MPLACSHAGASINDEGGYGQEFGGHGKGVSGMAINPFRSSVIPAKARLSGGHGEKLSPARYLAQSATRRLLSLPKHCNNSLGFKSFLSTVYGTAVSLYGGMVDAGIVPGAVLPHMARLKGLRRSAGCLTGKSPFESVIWRAWPQPERSGIIEGYRNERDTV